MDSYGEMEVVAAYLNLGASDCLIKPINFKSI